MAPHTCKRKASLTNHLPWQCRPGCEANLQHTIDPTVRLWALYTPSHTPRTVHLQIAVRWTLTCNRDVPYAAAAEMPQQRHTVNPPWGILMPACIHACSLAGVASLAAAMCMQASTKHLQQPCNLSKPAAHRQALISKHAACLTSNMPLPHTPTNAYSTLTICDTNAQRKCTLHCTTSEEHQASKKMAAAALHCSVTDPQAHYMGSWHALQVPHQAMQGPASVKIELSTRKVPCCWIAVGARRSCYHQWVTYIAHV